MNPHKCIYKEKFYHWVLFNRIEARLNDNTVSEASFNSLKLACDRKTNLRIDKLISHCADWIKDIELKCRKGQNCDFVEFRSSMHNNAEKNG